MLESDRSGVFLIVTVPRCAAAGAALYVTLEDPAVAVLDPPCPPVALLLATPPLPTPPPPPAAEALPPPAIPTPVPTPFIPTALPKAGN